MRKLGFIFVILAVFAFWACNETDNNGNDVCYKYCDLASSCCEADVSEETTSICKDSCEVVEGRDSGNSSFESDFGCAERNEGDCDGFSKCLTDNDIEMRISFRESDRRICKQACRKLLQCDSPNEGGPGALSEAWLDACENACDEADEIADDVSSCLVMHECASLTEKCGSGGSGQLQ